MLAVVYRRWQQADHKALDGGRLLRSRSLKYSEQPAVSAVRYFPLGENGGPTHRIFHALVIGGGLKI